MFDTNSGPVADEDPPPSRHYANRHAEAIRFHARNRMSRKVLETIYGKTAVEQVLGPEAAPVRVE